MASLSVMRDIPLQRYGAMDNSPIMSSYSYPVSPCKDCTDRHSGCHPKCEKYGEWKKVQSQLHDKHYIETMAKWRVKNYEVNKKSKKWRK